MKKLLLAFVLSVFLVSCTLTTQSGSADLNPDPDTIHAVSDLVRIVLAEK